MHTFQKIFFAAAFTGLSYSVAQPAQAISFNIGGSTIADAISNTTPSATDFTFVVSGVNPAQTSSVSLNLNLTNANLSQLEGYLFSPTNQRLNLFAFALGTTFANTNFIDSGAALGTGSDPYTGNFAADGFDNIELANTTPVSITTFAGFNGFNPNGTWTLRIYDTITGTTGTLGSSTLDIQSVPFEFEGTGGMLLLGGAFMAKRWYKKRKESSK